MNDEHESPKSLDERIKGVEEWVKKRDTIPPSTVSSLAAQFRLSKAEVRVIIDRARLKLGANAEKYVDAHLETVTQALALGQEGGQGAASALAVAQKGAEWAIERIAQGASRVIDQAKATAPTTPQIVIGIAVGGIQVKNTEESAGESNVMITPTEGGTGGEAEAKEGVIMTEAPELEAPIVLDRKTAKPPEPGVVPARVEAKKAKSAKQREIEAKVQKILMAVTIENAQVMMRSIIDLGYEPKFAWEMVKSMLDLEGKV
jgi:hypothetical protein